MHLDPNPLAHLWEWIEIHVGAQKETRSYYGFFSGFGSDLSEVTLIGGLIAVWHHHNCHNGGCWRLGKHTTPDGYKLCKKCVAKPKTDLTLHEVHPDHAKPNAAPAGTGRGPDGRFRRVP